MDLLVASSLQLVLVRPAQLSCRSGRVDGCEVLLTDPGASRTHAKLTFEKDALLVLDLGSANGTFVNEVRIAAPMPLQAGDRLRFNDETFEVAALELASPIVVVVAPEPVLATVVGLRSAGANATDARSSVTGARARPAAAEHLQQAAAATSCGIANVVNFRQTFRLQMEGRQPFKNLAIP